VAVQGAGLTDDQEETIGEEVQVRLTLPAFPPHPSEGGVFHWIHGLYEDDGTLTGIASPPGQTTPDGGYAVTIPASALGGTAFLPVQQAPPPG
jgi:hypothetical protein